MSVDLSKCKVGDKVNLMNGTVAELTSVTNCTLYPFIHDNGNGGYHGCGKDGKSCINEDAKDIVSRVGVPPAKRKVATFEIERDGFAWHASCYLGMWCSENYANKRNAIRGAKRFCARIGHECVIKEGV